MSPDEKGFSVFLNSPCYETPKSALKNDKNKNKNKTEQVTTFF
jgi:hypothetical protein